MKVLNYIVFIILCSLLATLPLKAQNIPEIHDDSLPLDPSVKIGELPNGFRYYIKQMEEPQERVLMHFVVKAGSRHEEDIQLDMAHAIEHLAFNPSNSFSKNFLNNSELLTTLGMRKEDIFAQTSWEYTDYNFDPAANHFTEGVDVGLQFFKAIANDIRFTNKEVKEEKGVLRQEVTYRVNNLLEMYVKSELQAKLFPCAKDKSNFFVLNEQMSPEGLTEFYQKWYRPDRMAIIIVGNIDNVETLEKKIVSTFSDLKNPSDHLNVKNCQKEYFKRPLQFVRLNRKLSKFSPVKDSRVEFYLFYRDTITREKIHSWQGLKRNFLWSLIPKLIEKKFQEKSSSYGDYKKIIASYSYVNHPSALRLFLTSTNNNEKEVLLQAIGAVQDLKVNGISAKEWESLKAEELKATYSGNLGSPSYWIDGLINKFAYNQAFPENGDVKLDKWFRDLSLEEFNHLLDVMLRKMPEDIGIIAPSGHYINDLSENEIRQWISEANSTNPEEIELVNIPGQLMTDGTKNSLTPADYEVKGVGESGAREIRLSNGVSVFLKPFQPSPGKDHNNIIIHGFSSKGALCFPEEDYYSAINAPDIVKFAGVGGFKRDELDRFLKNTSFWQGVFPYVKNFEAGMKGKAKKKDFEYLLQLIYLYFSDPRKDLRSFEAWKEKEIISYLVPTSGRIMTDFSDGIHHILEDKTQVPSGTRRIKGLDKTDFQRSYEIFNRLLRNPKEFTFTITGDFSIKEIMPLVQKYLGNISDSGKPFQCHQQQMKKKEMLKGPSFIKIPKPDHYIMESTEYTLRFLANQEGDFDWKEYILAKTLGHYLARKIDDLRFKKGAALYRMFAGTVYQDESSKYLYYISLDGIPEEINWLRQECKEMIKEIKTEPLDNAIFDEIKINILNELYGSIYLNRNDQVSERLYRNIRHDVPILKESEAARIVESITPVDIQEIAKRHLIDSNMFEFVMGKEVVE